MTQTTSKTRWVIKIGSALLTNDGKGLDKGAIANWVSQMASLHKKGIEIVLVSSGAIAEGMQRLDWVKKPNDIHKLQAAAAVGQMGLIQTYESAFAKFDIRSAQVLLTHENLSSSVCYENIKNTLNTLLNLGVIPIVNENDTVATEEIHFGDNDTLSAMVVNLINADRLVILTDQGGVYDKDPRHHEGAVLITDVSVDDMMLENVASRTSGSLGSGGMYTKILAAKKAKESNTDTYIASGREENILIRLANNESVGTHIRVSVNDSNAR